MAMRCAIVVSAGIVLMLSSITSTVEIPIENATGTPIANSMPKETASTKTSSHSITVPSS